MRNIKIAALQFSCCSQVQENIDKAETLVREAASNGANLILLPELFERPYFCQEKFYCTPGDTGFKVFETRFGAVGVGICWDQWFPETARCMAVQGAEILLYPTAIGSEPILNVDSSGHWRRVMQGHAAANLVPVAAANRIGTETVMPCEENGGQSSSLTFYGSSFIADATGELVASAGRDTEEILYASFDLDNLREERFSWGLFRDRRPETYRIMTKQ